MSSSQSQGRTRNVETDLLSVSLTSFGMYRIESCLLASSRRKGADLGCSVQVRAEVKSIICQ